MSVKKNLQKQLYKSKSMFAMYKFSPKLCQKISNSELISLISII